MSAKKKDISQIKNYLEGKLDNKAMHQLERQAQDDPFLMEALEGYETAGGDQQINLTELQDRLTRRINAEKGRSVLLWRVLPIAACLLLTLGTGYWLFAPQPGKIKYANVIPADKQIVKQPSPSASKKVEDTLPADKTINNDDLKNLAVTSPVRAKRQGKKQKTVSKDTAMLGITTGDAIASVSVIREDKPLPAARMATLPEPQDNPISNKKDLLQGNLAGYNNTGAPGMRGSVNIRGTYGRSSSDSNNYGALKKSSSINFVTITGVVIDSRTKDIIPFATITTEGKYLAQTDVDGKYVVTVPEGAVLTAASVGYIAQKVKLHQQTSLNYALSANTQPLAETVIRGYVKRAKNDSTNPSYIITGKEVQDNPVGNVEQLLQGKVAKLNIQNNVELPITKDSVSIRGLSTINTPATQAGLVYVVTGIITDGKSGKPVAGATLSQGGPATIQSGVDGKFKFTNVGQSLLTVTMNGYLPKQVKIDKKSDLKISLRKDNRTHPASTGLDCKENLKFKKAFFDNVAIAERYTIEREERHSSIVSNAQFLEALKFIARYTLVSVRTDLKDQEIYYSRATFAIEKTNWLKWYEDNKCNN